LSHLCCYPTLHQSQAPANSSKSHAVPVLLELKKPGEPNAYSFESHNDMNPASSLRFLPCNDAPQQFYSRDPYNQYQVHQPASSNSLQSPWTGFANSRSQSESEGLGSWAGINTPITPSDMNVQNRCHKHDLTSHDSSGFSHHDHRLRLTMSYLLPI
jgi:hypothetical protein